MGAQPDLTWNKGGVSYDADPSHAEIAIDELGLKDAKGVVSPDTKEEGNTKDDHDTKLYEFHISKSNAIVARLNYLASDRPDITFSVKGLARITNNPTRGARIS